MSNPHDSLVFSMLSKLLDKKVPVFIDVKDHHFGLSNFRFKGRIRAVDYWTTENIFNVQYDFRDEDDEMRIKDYRFRSLTPKLLDNTFTLKKIDGIYTLVRKEEKPEEPIEEAKEEDEELQTELSMAGKIALRTIKKWFDDGKKVVLDKVEAAGTTASGDLAGMTDKGDDVWLFKMSWPEGWSAQSYIIPATFNTMKLSVQDEDGEKVLKVTTKKLKEEHKEPLVISMVKKVLRSGAKIKFINANGEERYFNQLRTTTNDAGEISKYKFVNQHPNTHGILAGEKEVQNIGRLKLKKQETKAPDGSELWHLFDTKYVKEEEEREHILVSMLRKLHPEIEKHNVYYAFNSFAEKKHISKLKFQPLKKGSPQGDISVDIRLLENGWMASLTEQSFNKFTIKSFNELGKKKWVLIKKEIADQVEDIK